MKEQTPHGEDHPRKYARISPKNWNPQFTDLSIRALKTGVIVSLASSTSIAVFIVEKSQTGLGASVIAASIAIPATIILAAKEKIETKARRENNITNPPNK